MAIEQIFTLDFASQLAAMFPTHRAAVTPGPSAPVQRNERAGAHRPDALNRRIDVKATSPGFLARRAGVTLIAVAALFLGACTCATGPAFRITAPAEGDTLSAEACKAVPVSVTPVAGDYCTFPPKAYEISVDGGTSQMIPADKTPLAATFNDLATGPHTATAWAIGQNGKRRETASVKFTCAPPPPPPCRAGSGSAAAPAGRRPRGPDREGLHPGHLLRLRQVGDPAGLAREARQGRRLDEGAPGGRVPPRGSLRRARHPRVQPRPRRPPRERDEGLPRRRSASTAAKLKTISYGKERPFVEGHDESAWSKNRRTHFVLTKK